MSARLGQGHVERMSLELAGGAQWKKVSFGFVELHAGTESHAPAQTPLRNAAA
jgi:hypothetical protein